MSSDRKKRQHEEGKDEEKESVQPGNIAKKLKFSSHTFPLSVKFWVLKNYDYDPAECYCRLADMMAHLQSDDEMSEQNGGKPLSHCQARLRPIIRDFWDGKVLFTHRRFQKGGKRVRALKHLRRKDFNSAIKPQSESSASKHVIMVPGWQVVINNDHSLSLLRVEDWLLDQQRVLTEIRADQKEDSTQYICSISSHGRILDPKQMGLKLGQMTNPKEELELLARCMSASKLCKGFIFGDSGVPSHSEFRVAEYSTASSPSMPETRIFSSKCQVVCSSRSTCIDCIKCKQAIRKKKQRGKFKNAKANHRFMNREQLVSKIKELQKELQSCRQKIRRLEYGDGADKQTDSDEDGANDNGDASNDREDNSDGSDDDDDDDEDNSGNSGSDDDDDDEDSHDGDDDKDEDNDVNTSADCKQGDNDEDSDN